MKMRSRIHADHFRFHEILPDIFEVSPLTDTVPQAFPSEQGSPELLS